MKIVYKKVNDLIPYKNNAKYFVYIHIFPNNKKYIGITSQTTQRRWKNGKGYKSQKMLTRAINKYGWGNIEHIVLFKNLTQEEAEQKRNRINR